MADQRLLVVKRCDASYPLWQDITDPASVREAHADYDRLTQPETCSKMRLQWPSFGQLFPQ
jgi:hypothetical protein